MRKPRIALSLLIGAIFVFSSGTLRAQAQDAGAEPGAAEISDSGQPKDVLMGRVHRQHMRIKRCLLQGSVTQEQADQLNQQVDQLAAEIKATREKNGGELKLEEFKQMQSSLNQMSNQIDTFEKSGTKKVQSGKVLGPKWKPGLDGAQNPKKLKQEMKAENRRELRQERQNTEQKIEQQQLQYEREMVERLGEQREDINKQKEEIKEVRKESGAD